MMRGARAQGVITAAILLAAACAGCGDDEAGTTSATTRAPTTTEAVTTTAAPATTAAPETTTTTEAAITAATTEPAAAADLIVFNRMMPDDTIQILTIDPDTGESVQLTEDFSLALMPVWSPDRGQIAFWTAGDEEYLWVMNADGSDPQQVTDFSSAVPDWWGMESLVSNNDSEGEEQDVPDIVGVVIGSPEDRFQLVDSDPTMDFRPRVSPDETRILFVSDREDPFLDLWVLEILSGELTNLTADQVGTEMNGDWSPDGSKIVYTADRGEGPDIWMMNADGSDPWPLVERSGSDDHPSWSPDGTRIVFASSPTSDLWIVGADGENLIRLTAEETADMFPNWS